MLERVTVRKTRMNNKITKILLVLISFLFVSCNSQRLVGSFCLWAKPITLTESDLDKISTETLRQINNYNKELETQCY